MLLLKLSGKTHFVTGRNGSVGQNFLGPGPDNRSRGVLLVNVGLNRDHSLMVDTVYLTQTAGDLEFGDCAQGNQTFLRWDEQLAQDVGYPAIRLGQLHRNVVVLITLPECGDLYTVKSHL
ncbi:hypothetical protein ES703_119037 [subsurface metagenome]